MTKVIVGGGSSVSLRGTIKPSMVYPGAGIALSTGSAWGTSITDNSSNWNTAYGWGDHASAGYLTSLTDGNGTTVNGTDGVDWGGTLTTDVFIDGNYGFNLGNTTPLVSTSISVDNRIEFNVNNANGSGYLGFIAGNPGDAGFHMEIGDSDYQHIFDVNNTGALLEQIDNISGNVSTLYLDNTYSLLSFNSKRLKFETSGTTLDLGSDATGDTYYRNSSGYFTRLPVGTNGDVLTLASGLPSWAAPSSSFTLVDGNGTTVNGTGDGVDWGGTLTTDVFIDGTGMSVLFGNTDPIALFGVVSSGDINFYNDDGAGAYCQLSMAAAGGASAYVMNVDDGNGFTFNQSVQNTSVQNTAIYNSGNTATVSLNDNEAGISRTGAGGTITKGLVFNDTGTTLDLGSDASQDLYKRDPSGHLVRIPLGSSGDVLTNVSGTVGWAAPSGGGGLTVGTSTITSGTNTKVLYNNSGVLGEYTVSGTGNVALTTSPTFTTPALGTPSALVGTNITGTATGLTSGITNALKSATTTVDVSAATAPTSGQVLTATSGTAATWQTPASASGAWLLASGGTATGTNTFAMGSNPFILTSGVTTGTGATAGIQNVFNSLTTGNGLDISTSSLTTGKGLALTSTSTAINHTIGTNALFSSRISGTNANSSRTAVAGEFIATNTGTTSSNIAIYAEASGGTTNYSFYASGQMYVEGLTTSSYVAYFKAGGLNQGIYISSNGGGILPIQSSWTDLGNSSQRFKNAFFSGNVSTGGITTVLATLHSRGTGTTTGYNLLTENSGATTRFGVRDNGAIEFSGSAGTSGYLLQSNGATSPPTWVVAPSGITNGAANTELMMSNGTNAIASGIFYASDTLSIGTAIAGASRTISATGSASTVDLLINSKGFGFITLNGMRIFSDSDLNGSDNYFIGKAAGNATLSGIDNTGFGPGVLQDLTTGDYNMAFGNLAGANITTGDNNLLIGGGAGTELTTSYNNLMIGVLSATQNTGHTNFIIGNGSSTLMTTGNNNFLLGNNLEFQSNTADNQFTIANAIFGVGHNTTGTTISSGNLGLFTNSWGTSAARVISIGNGTAPSTFIANGVQVHAEDNNSSSEFYVTTESGAKVNISGLFEPVTESGTSFTLNETHRNKVVICSNSGVVTVTVGSGKAAGWNCMLVATHATGTISLTTSGTTINGSTSTTTQFETLSLVHYGSENYLSKLG
jgi:hypothetical protein